LSKITVTLIILLTSFFLISCADPSGSSNTRKAQLSEQDLEADEADEPTSKEIFSKLPSRDFKNSSLSEISKWVIKNEAKKIGPYCNFFVQRVLQLKGYGFYRWRANDFDTFVAKTFDSFQVETFTSQNIEIEQERLKNYIWSFPEKTDFILQWKRPSKHGHVAILQRVGDKLIIYNASLNDYLARSKQAKVEVLLNSGRGKKYRLNVYSNFVKGR
jgi:hypothetical protein